MSDKTVLVLGASELQLPAIRKAKKWVLIVLRLIMIRTQ